jgi:DNA repair photolyase
MSDLINSVGTSPKTATLLSFPQIPIVPMPLTEQPKRATPIFDELFAEGQKLDKLSKYPCSFDYDVYRKLELRYADKPVRGGTVMRTVFRLVNSHSTCQQCLYSFEIDTYGRGCVHECVYCYAKAELTVHGSWNNPIPMPVDINEIRRVFYTVFETTKVSKWRPMLEARVPLRIGSMSDSFMGMDHKYKVTQELLKILSFYNYPYVVFTRSDLVAHDDYIKLLNPKLASVQFSLSSTNDELVRKIEPGAPSAKRRLNAIAKLNEAGFWTTVRLNPLFPIHPDGFFTNPNFEWSGDVPKFNYSSFEMVDELAFYKVPAVLAGFVRLSGFALNQIEKAAGVNLRQYYRKDLVAKGRNFHFSDAEVRYYYEQIKKRCIANAMEFTTCYIGNGDEHFWKDQDLWSNKKDCCNIKDRVPAFKNDARSIPFDLRLKFGGKNRQGEPVDPKRLHQPLGLTPLKSIDSAPPDIQI